jgi:hypothetical protein
MSPLEKAHSALISNYIKGRHPFKSVVKSVVDIAIAVVVMV